MKIYFEVNFTNSGSTLSINYAQPNILLTILARFLNFSVTLPIRRQKFPKILNFSKKAPDVTNKLPPTPFKLKERNFWHSHAIHKNLLIELRILFVHGRPMKLHSVNLLSHQMKLSKTLCWKLNKVKKLLSFKLHRSSHVAGYTEMLNEFLKSVHVVKYFDASFKMLISGGQ